MGLHDPLHSQQACPELNSFHEEVGQLCPCEGLFKHRPLPKRGQICDVPAPPIVESQDLRLYSKHEISPHPRFTSIQVNGYTFEYIYIYAVQRQYQLGASIRPLKPLHAACADRLEREVHERARRLKFLCLGMPCVARTRRLKHPR